MFIFHCYVKLPEGVRIYVFLCFFHFWPTPVNPHFGESNLVQQENPLAVTPNFVRINATPYGLPK